MKGEKPNFGKAVDIRAYIYEKFGICGCAELETVLLEIKKLLKWGCRETSKRDCYDKLYNRSGIFYIIAGIMDNIGLLEHGTSIRCAWTTRLGLELLEGLNAFSFRDIEESKGEAYNGCYFDC